MKPETTFIADRRVAQHCAELVARAPDPAMLLADFGRVARQAAERFATLLAPINGGSVPKVDVDPPRELGESDLIQDCGALAANCLMALPQPGMTLVASIEGAAILRLIDRAFGGRGDLPDPMPAAFPLSAELLIGRIELLLAGALGDAMGCPDPLRTLRRNASLRELAPFPAGARIAAVRCLIADEMSAPWSLTLALPVPMLRKLFGAAKTASMPAPRGAADPAAAPFADVPLPLTALLVDMAVPMSTVAGLAPGTVLPVAVARQVPLRIGDRTLARGAVGSQDDRVALQLISLS